MRLTGAFRFVVVAAPSYLANHGGLAMGLVEHRSQRSGPLRLFIETAGAFAAKRS